MLTEVSTNRPDIFTALLLRVFDDPDLNAKLQFKPHDRIIEHILKKDDSVLKDALGELQQRISYLSSHNNPSESEPKEQEEDFERKAGEKGLLTLCETSSSVQQLQCLKCGRLGSMITAVSNERHPEGGGFGQLVEYGPPTDTVSKKLMNKKLNHVCVCTIVHNYYA